MTQPCYTFSVAFSNQGYVSQPLPSAFNYAVNANCWALVYIVTQQLLSWQNEMLLFFVTVCMFLVPSIPRYPLEWKCRVSRASLLIAVCPAPVMMLGIQYGLKKYFLMGVSLRLDVGKSLPISEFN